MDLLCEAETFERYIEWKTNRWIRHNVVEEVWTLDNSQPSPVCFMVSERNIHRSWPMEYLKKRVSVHELANEFRSLSLLGLVDRIQPD